MHSAEWRGLVTVPPPEPPPARFACIPRDAVNPSRLLLMSFESRPGSNPLSNETGGHAEHGPSPTGGGGSTQSKPIRLALACNQCRKRKVRCDAQHQSCRNCIVRGDVCETSDPRKPANFPAVRRRATRCCQAKGRNDAEKTVSPVRRSLSTVTPAAVAVSSINSVLDPTGPSPDTRIDQTSPSVLRSSRSSAFPVSVSPATSSWQTNQSERLG